MAELELYMSYYKCDIILLTKEVLFCEYSSYEKGADLLEKVCRFLKIIERYHFGLKFMDYNGHFKWLHLHKLVMPQIHCQVTKFFFEVRFYPMLPNDIRDFQARKQIFLQLRDNFANDKYLLSQTMQVFLLGLLLYIDFGRNHNNYHYHDVLNKKPKIIQDQAIYMHQHQLNGTSKLRVMECFLITIGNLESYGMEIYEMVDSKNNTCYIGVNYQGISIFHNKILNDIFLWNDIEKFQCQEHLFVIQLLTHDCKVYDCGTKNKCFYVWKLVMDHLIHFCIRDEEPVAHRSDIRNVLVDFTDDSYEKFTEATDKSVSPVNEKFENFIWNLDHQIDVDLLNKSDTSPTVSHNNDVTEKKPSKELIGKNFVYITFSIFVLMFVAKGHFKVILANLFIKLFDIPDGESFLNILNY